VKCPQCGAENPAKNKFCGECGFNLKATAAVDRMNIIKKDIPDTLVKKILGVKDTIEKERRNVTVIFADISGFTTMSEKLDPEELTALMNECFRKLSMMVYRYEGIIDKFIGDCVMAIFGAPVTHEDDPERAVLAGLDMQTAIREVNARLDISRVHKQLEIHTGINSGEVIAGKVGSDLQMDYTVMGDTVNVAQRLKDIAAPGTIVVGPETFRRTKHAFDYIGSEPVQLKGKVESVNPYEVIGRKWGSEFGSSTVHSDLIGRDLELNQFKGGYGALLNNKPRIFLIKGEIGVGKSRLLYEFKKYLSITASDIILMEDRGVSYESSIPLKSFYDCFTRYFLSEETKITEASKAKIIAKINEILGADAPDIAPYLYKLLNIEISKDDQEKIIHLDSHSLQLQIFLAVSTLIEKLAEKKKIIFLFDDLQWSDLSSNELISFLLPMVKKGRVSFYLSYRSGEPANLKKIFDTLKNELTDLTSEIELGNLNAADSALMVNNLAGTAISDEVKRAIVERSGGNPFFIEEIVRNILETGEKTPAGKTDRTAASDYARIQVPGSIESAVTSRLDALDKEAKHIIKTASIIGRFFPQRLLEEVVNDKEVYRHVEDLENGEFLIKVNHNNRLYYSFRHPIFQEVTYHSLLKSERAIYHKVIAETIETKFTDKDEIEGYYATLGYHFLNCQILVKALDYLVKAGNEAAAISANDEALNFYGQALTIAERNADKVVILEKMLELEHLTGKIDDACRHVDEAMEWTDDPETRARLTGMKGKLLADTGKLDEGLAMMKQALSEFHDQNNVNYLHLSFYLADLLLERKADLGQAAELVENAITIARRIDHAKSIGNGQRMKGQILWRKGDSSTSMKLLKEAEQTYLSLGSKSDLASLYILIGVVARSMGNIPMAIDFLNESIKIAGRIGSKKLQAIAHNNLGIYYHFLGDIKSGLASYERNLTLRNEIGDERGTAIAYGNIGIIYNQTGDYDKAMEYYRKAQDILEKVNDVRGQINNMLSFSPMMVEMDRIDEAREFHRKVLAMAEATGDNLLFLAVKEHVAVDLITAGEIDQAAEILDSVKDSVLKLGNMNMITDLRLHCANVLVQKQHPEALSAAQEAFKLAQASKDRTNEIQGLRILGQAQVLSGQEKNVEEGLKNLKRAISAATETGYFPEVADSRLALAEALIKCGKEKQAAEYLNQAKEIYARLKSKLKLKKIENLLNTIQK
jgi:adenylate cyclase